MSKFNAVVYKQLSTTTEVAQGIVSYEPFKAIKRVAIECKLEELPQNLKNFAEAFVVDYGAVIALAYPDRSERKPNGWTKFEGTRRNQVCLG